MKQRLKRLWAPHLKAGLYPQHGFWLLLERFLLFADALFLPEFLTLLNRLFKWNTRRLTANEQAALQIIFGETIDFQKIRIDERSHLGCRQRRFAYVSFNLINSWGRLSGPHFIHELVHVWQFQRFGSTYIPRALWAQRTTHGYNYGGFEAVKKTAEEGKGMEAFNFEQQGDIVADYFCLKQGLTPRWCACNPIYLPYFERVVHKSLFG